MPTALDHFIEEMLDRASRRSCVLAGLDLILTVAVHFWESRHHARALPTSGLHPRLIANNQLGQAWRHLRAHAACALIGGPMGRGAAHYLNSLDIRQASTGRAESLTEIECNAAGIQVGHILRNVINGSLSRSDARQELTLTLAHTPRV